MTIRNATSEAAPAITSAENLINDKARYAQRWHFSKRHVDNLIAQGLPHLAIGKRRVRIVVAEADAWMKEKFSTQRRGSGPATSVTKGPNL